MRKEKAFAVLRIAFGLVWAVDAWLKWQPAFLNGLPFYLMDAMRGQPEGVAGWINFWIGIVSINPHFFGVLVACAETALALALILGFATEIAAYGGIVLSLIIWTAAEGFGGPYMSGSTDIGAAILYVFIFIALLIEKSNDAYSLDALLQKKYPALFGRGEEQGAGSKKDGRNTFLKIALAIAIVIIVVFLAGSSASLAPSQTANSTDPNLIGLGAMPGMAIQEFNINPSSSIPTVDFAVAKDSKGGWNLHILTTNFTFTPQNENQAPVPNEGHAHLYIDGLLSVVYGPWYHFDDLSPGGHTIVVTLNANDHSVFAVNGTYIKKLETIVQN